MPKIAYEPSPITQFETSFCNIYSDYCKRIFQIGARVVLIANLPNRVRQTSRWERVNLPQFNSFTAL
jgi:hypothetical protein